MRSIILCLAVLFSSDVHAIAHENERMIPKTSTSTYNPKTIKSKSKVLILDVDNCLYSESEIKATTANGNGIEHQIITNTHIFGSKELNLTKEECDGMYLSHGSTIEGIRQKLISEGRNDESIHEVLRQYYHFVYDGIDMTCLLPLSESESSLVNTGYNHAMSRTRREVIRDMLQSMPFPIYFASNSPKQHVMKVLSALGLKNVDYEGLLTPDTVGGHGKMEYPTKFHPTEFFQSLLERYDVHVDELILVDDSGNNLRKATEIGIQGLQVNVGGAMNLEEALSVFAGHVESKLLVSNVGDAEEAYEFSDVKYLQSKNVVDMDAINPAVWEKVALELFRNIGDDVELLRIVDVGAGLLSMLELVLLGGGGKEALVKHMKQGMKLEYIAYESNRNLMESCRNRLNAMGFESMDKSDSEEYIFEKKALNVGDIEVKVVVRIKDFTEESLAKEERPHLIVGCCFADLFDPSELVSSLARFTNHYSYGGGVHSENLHDILFYFPITFAGTTQFDPPKPFALSGDTIIPSDTLAFQLYADSLIQQHGHNLDPAKIVTAMSDIGALLVTSASSVWHIDPTQNEYLWNTMLYFFGNSASPQIMKRRWDSVGWLDRARTNRPIIRVMNRDLLFALPAAHESTTNNAVVDSGTTCDATSAEVVEEIEFQAPNKVGKKIKEASQTQLGPHQVEGKNQSE